MELPDYAQEALLKLQTSISKYHDEVLQKCNIACIYSPGLYMSYCRADIVGNDAVPKVMHELAKSLNATMQRNLSVVKSIDGGARRVKLGKSI